MHTMKVALAAAERDADLPGQAHMLTSLAGAGYYLGRPDEAVPFLGQRRGASLPRPPGGLSRPRLMPGATAPQAPARPHREFSA